MIRIAVIGSQHGNELLGEQLYAYITQYEVALAKHVTFMLANPKARKKNVRFIESDMNRSYVGTRGTYEERLADDLLQHLQREQFDLVIDAHTTTVNDPPCVITTRLSPTTRAFLRASHIRNVVVMEHAFGSRSLVGKLPEALSVEVCEQQLGTPLFTRLCTDLKRYLSGNTQNVTKNVYTVRSLLVKGTMSEQTLATLKNFIELPDGTYPVLVGEKAYRDHTDYLGFLAGTKEVIEV